MFFEKKRIALVHDALTVPGGAEKVLLELHHLFPDAPIYTPLYNPELFPEFKNADVRTSSLNRFPWLRKKHQMLIPFFPYTIEQFDLSSFDIVISDSSAAAKGAITRPDALHICYCHTPMRWAWLPYLDKRASVSFIRRLMAHYLRMWDVVSSSRVDAWIANSHTTAARIAKFYKATSVVIPPPVPVSNNPTRNHNNYFLSVGRLVEQKKTALLIQAAIQTGIHLKIAGMGPEYKSLKHLAKNHPNIEFLGYVDGATKLKLYEECQAFLFAAEEDAGIAPVEAMSFGKPVIAYGRGGASEVIIDGKTGLLFDEQTVSSLAIALSRFKTINFDYLEIAHHASQFSPEQFRKKILSFIEGFFTEHSDFKSKFIDSEELTSLFQSLQKK